MAMAESLSNAEVFHFICCYHKLDCLVNAKIKTEQSCTYNYFLHPSTYSACFAEAGLLSFSWQEPWLSPVGEQTFPTGFWGDMLKDPPKAPAVDALALPPGHASRGAYTQNATTPVEPWPLYR
jgi:hypothetical protein